MCVKVLPGCTCWLAGVVRRGYRKGHAKGSDQRTKGYKNVIKLGAAAYLG
ncbi:hypothetical protein AH4AK4_3097 [Aeromonas hydrophila 4AK4]|nr:hypothetical protein AH4AK4_3097 [Aeromonas hydrophila 4AK4]